MAPKSAAGPRPRSAHTHPYIGSRVCMCPFHGGQATAGLEKKQSAKYAGDPKYEAWVKSSWAGPMIPGAA